MTKNFFAMFAEVSYLLLPPTRSVVFIAAFICDSVFSLTAPVPPIIVACSVVRVARYSVCSLVSPLSAVRSSGLPTADALIASAKLVPETMSRCWFVTPAALRTSMFV